MSDEDALLAAIAANPDEDTPRLAYADWLDENATCDAQRARAEFIRVQIEAARVYDARARDAYDLLDGRAKALQERYARAWVAELTVAPATKSEYYGGFLSRLELAAEACASTRRPRWHREPLARVKLRGTAAAVRALCDGWLDGVHALDINLTSATDPDTDAVAETLAGSGCATSLHEIMFWSDALTDRALRALAGGTFPKLTELSLMGQFTPDGWANLLNSPAAGRLTDLTAGHHAPWQAADATRPGPRLADAIVGAPVHSALTCLWVSSCGLGDAGAARLAGGRFDRVKSFSIDNDHLGGAALDALASGHFPALADVRFSSCELNDDAVAPLAVSSLLARLERLDVSMNELTAASAVALVAGDRPRLKELNLSFNDVGDAGAAALAAVPLPALEELNLSQTRLTDAGADAIARAPWAGQLKSLFLSFNAVSDAKAEELKAQFGRLLWIESS